MTDLAALQTLCSGLAHELRNPLNAAKLQLEVLARRLRRDRADPQLVGPVEAVDHELERLARMVDEFLAFARPADLALGDHDVTALAADAIAALAPLVAARRAWIVFAEGDAVRARVDPRKIGQIVESLVRNAVEAGRVIGVSVIADGARVHIQVADDGPGIAPAVLPRIYEPFFSTKENGTGLGMSIVHTMVALHGGSIAVETSAAGTRFDVALPLA